MASCLNAFITRVGESLSATISRYTPTPSVKVSCVCSVTIDDSDYEIFMVKEGVFLLSDGNTFNVIRK